MTTKKNSPADVRLKLIPEEEKGLWRSFILFIQQKPYSWLFLILAIIFEVLGISYLSLSESYTRVIPTILYFIFFLAAIVLLPPISEALGIGIAYFIWSGIGSMATVVVGRLELDETIEPLKAVGMGLILTGVLIICWTTKKKKKRRSSSRPKSYDRLKVSPSPMLMQSSPIIHHRRSQGLWGTYIYLSHTKPWAWLMLLLAIMLEVAGTTCMRLSNSYTKVVPSVMYFVCYAISSILLPPVAEGLGIAIVYVIWSGVGSLAAVMIGRFVFDESIGAYKGIGMVAVVIGAVAMAWGDEVEEGAMMTPFIRSPAGLVAKIPHKRGGYNEDLLHGKPRPY